MKAIRTVYRGPSFNCGSVIIATDNDKNKITIRCDERLRHNENHFAAAVALAKKMNWIGKLIQGSIGPGEFVHVWYDSNLEREVTCKTPIQ